MPQMKVQGEFQEKKELNEMEASELSEFKTVVVRMLKELSETLTRDNMHIK